MAAADITHTMEKSVIDGTIMKHAAIWLCTCSLSWVSHAMPWINDIILHLYCHHMHAPFKCFFELHMKVMCMHVSQVLELIVKPNTALLVHVIISHTQHTSLVW
jgi:hypothetical protein